MAFKTGPRARSGHRMVRYKNSLVLFGGFYDTGFEVPLATQCCQTPASGFEDADVFAQVNYFNDLHIFDLDKQARRAVDTLSSSTPLLTFLQEWRKIGDDPRGDNR